MQTYENWTYPCQPIPISSQDLYLKDRNSREQAEPRIHLFAVLHKWIMFQVITRTVFPYSTYFVTRDFAFNRTQTIEYRFVFSLVCRTDSPIITSESWTKIWNRRCSRSGGEWGWLKSKRQRIPWRLMSLLACGYQFESNKRTQFIQASFFIVIC